MDPMIFTDIPFTVKAESIAKRMHIELDSEDGVELRSLIAKATETARPKAMVRECYIDEHGEDHVLIEGVRFDSKLVARQLAPVHRVFAFVATCGQEVRQWALGIADPFTAYWADAVMETVLGGATGFLHSQVAGLMGGGKFASMNPGSLEAAWPITQQRPLFDLLGDVTGAIGVELTDSMLMVPAKSVSGIYFATEHDYQNCMYCQRPNCPGRRAAFDPGKGEALNVH